LFSATFKRNVEDLARETLEDPVRISIGAAGDANENVTQLVFVLEDNNEKWPWLMQSLGSMVSEGSVLIFTSTKASAEELSSRLKGKGFHG
jgi:superfamily II DNA/RNA helicase